MESECLPTVAPLTFDVRETRQPAPLAGAGTHGGRSAVPCSLAGRRSLGRVVAEGVLGFLLLARDRQCPGSVVR